MIDSFIRTFNDRLVGFGEGWRRVGRVELRVLEGAPKRKKRRMKKNIIIMNE
jgi:hypothetical protein